MHQRTTILGPEDGMISRIQQTRMARLHPDHLQAYTFSNHSNVFEPKLCAP